MDDVIFDIKKFEILKKIPGTFDPTEYQNGKYITYTANRIALDFDPKNGDRKILVDYRSNLLSGVHGIDIPQKGAQYFYLNNELYLINGETPINILESSGKYLHKNTVFHFDQQHKKWNSIFDINDNPIVIIHNDKKLIILCRQSIVEFSYSSGKFEKIEVPIEGYSWKSMGELKNSYLISGINKSNEVVLFLASKDFKNFDIIQVLNDFSNPKISTMITPISPKQILQ